MINSNEEMGMRLGYLRDVKFGKMHGSKTMCANELNISTGYWGDIERGRKKIGIDLIQKLAAFFNTDCEWLITGKSFDTRFLVEYHTVEYRQDSLWYESLVYLLDLAVKFRKQKNNKFFQAAAMTFKCREDQELWAELEGLYADSSAPDVLIEELVARDGGKSARSKLGRTVRTIIKNVEADLLVIEDSGYDDLPSVIPQIDSAMDSETVIKLLEDKVLELQEQVEKLTKQLQREKNKIIKLKSKQA